MKVLVVDDQVNVVQGIVSGVNWNDISVERVFKAYNSFEAKEIIHSNPVDIMLCDIEMPVESGLDLFRWVKEQQKDIECIFLTAHADFSYAKEAIHLGSFDYILQPARYADIENAIKRVSHKITLKSETQKYYTYGKILYDKKDRLMDALVHDWLFAKDQRDVSTLETLEKLGVPLKSDKSVYFVLLDMIKWGPGSGHWETDLLRYALNNVISELFEPYEQCLILTQLDESSFCIIIYPSDGFPMEDQSFIYQLDALIDICKKYIGCSIACYTGKPISPKMLPQRYNELMKIRCDNVSLTSRVFFLGREEASRRKSIELPNMRIWENLLLHGIADSVINDTKTYLESLSSSGEKLDLIPNFALNTTTAANNKQILPLNDLLKEYGKDMLEQISEEDWACVTIDGKIYAIPNNKEKAQGFGIAMRTDILTKLNYDVSRIKTEADLDILFQAVKEGNPDMYPLVSDNGGIGYMMVARDELGGDYGILVPCFDENNTKVVNWYETEEYMNVIKTRYKWAQEGLIMPDASTNNENDGIENTHYVKDEANGVIDYPEGLDAATTTYSSVA